MTWSFVIFSYLSLFCLGLFDNIRGPYLPDIISDLNLTDSKGSLIYITAAFFGILGSVFSTKAMSIFKNISPMQGLRAGLITLGLGIFIASFAKDHWRLIWGFSIFGLGVGILSVFQYVCIQQGVTSKRLRSFLSGLHSMYALSSLAAPVLVYYTHDYWTWDKAFSYIPIIAAVLLVATYLKPYRVKKSLGEGEGKKSSASIHTRLRIYYLALLLGTYTCFEISLASRFVLYLRRYYGFNRAEGSEYLSYFFLSLFVSRILYTFYSFPKVKSKTILFTAYSLALVSCLLGIYSHPWFFFASAFFMGPAFPQGFHYMTEQFPEYASQAAGETFTILGITIVLMHYFVGFFSDLYSLEFAMHIGPVSMIIGIIMLAFQDRVNKKIDSLNFSDKPFLLRFLKNN